MKISESIWSNNQFIIPMAEVAFIEKLHDSNNCKNRIFIFFKHSKWDDEQKIMNPHVYLENSNGESFKKDWCIYRSEVESVAYNPHSLDMASDNLKGFFNDIQNICNEYKPIQ